MSVDDMVERVVALLRKQHILNNTYIIFTSDNGFHLGAFIILFCHSLCAISFKYMYLMVNV